jgi:hypothetical protein
LRRLSRRRNREESSQQTVQNKPSHGRDGAEFPAANRRGAYLVPRRTCSQVAARLPVPDPPKQPKPASCFILGFIQNSPPELFRQHAIHWPVFQFRSSISQISRYRASQARGADKNYDRGNPCCINCCCMDLSCIDLCRRIHIRSRS